MSIYCGINSRVRYGRSRQLRCRKSWLSHSNGILSPPPPVSRNAIYDDESAVIARNPQILRRSFRSLAVCPWKRVGRAVLRFVPGGEPAPTSVDSVSDAPSASACAMLRQVHSAMNLRLAERALALEAIDVTGRLNSMTSTC